MSGQTEAASTTREVLADCYPDLAKKLTLHTPDEKNKRHGQAIAKATLPSLQAVTKPTG